MSDTMPIDLCVPDDAVDALRRAVDYGKVYNDDDVKPVATPVVVAELLALAGKVLNLPAPDGVDPDGFDAARWAFREMIADRCDELGVKVEEL